MLNTLLLHTSSITYHLQSEPQFPIIYVLHDFSLDAVGSSPNRHRGRDRSPDFYGNITIKDGRPLMKTLTVNVTSPGNIWDIHQTQRAYSMVLPKPSQLSDIGLPRPLFGPARNRSRSLHATPPQEVGSSSNISSLHYIYSVVWVG